MDRDSILELIRVSLRVWPQTPADLMKVEWPFDTDGQGSVIKHLASVTQNPAWGWQIRAWAYEYLENLARELGERGEPGSVPIELAAWSFGVVSGKIQRPHPARGRDVSANAIRDMKFDALERWLREYFGYSRDDAIHLIAEAANLSEEAVMSALGKRRRRVRRTPDQMLQAGINIWGEQIT